MSEKNVEVMELIETLYSMVTEAWGVPLGNDKCIVERENVLEILNEIKTRIPVELAEAKRLVSARDEFIGNAKREADGIIRSAEERAKAMTAQEEIVKLAQQKAAEIIATSQQKSREMRKAAQDFVDDIMRRADEGLTANLGEVRKTRAALKQQIPSAKEN